MNTQGASDSERLGADFVARLAPLRDQHWPVMAELIAETLRGAHRDDSSLVSACDYHLATGGKRLRATLPLLIAEALGADPEALAPFGAACEMLHNATLVHDDLQDGDTLRRGKETVWRRFGAARAINLGDAMFYYAVLLVRRVRAEPAQRDRALDLLLGETLEVIDGQEREITMRAEPAPSLDDYLAMVERKTSGLFALPMKGAAILCGASEAVVTALGEAACHLGVLFQIQDDLLDLYGDKGRDQRASDVAEGKRSILFVHAMNAAEPERARWLLEISDKPREETTADEREEACALFQRCGAVEAAQAELARRRQAALAAVADLGAPQLEALVTGLADLFVRPLVDTDLQPPAVAPNGDSQADREFCLRILPEVSRTFALSIAALPDELADAVLAAYLLCRIVDTIEDEPGLELAARDELFDCFDAVLDDDDADPRIFETLVTSRALAESTADGELCGRAGAVLNLFRSLPAAQRKVIRPRVSVMLEGMRSYCRRAHRYGSLRLRDLEELEQYCYYVAGAVGRLLTDLFLQAIPDIDAAGRRLASETAVSFGIGLQLVNIVKDVAEDLERGVCFLPESLARHHGVELESILEPKNRAAGLAVVRAVCARARFHLERAKTYTLTWPAPAGEAVRLFCTVPLSLALATLVEVETGDQTLRQNETPKISREAVGRLLSEARTAVGDDEQLARLFAGAEGGARG